MLGLVWSSSSSSFFSFSHSVSGFGYNFFFPFLFIGFFFFFSMIFAHSGGDRGLLFLFYGVGGWSLSSKGGVPTATMIGV